MKYAFIQLHNDNGDTEWYSQAVYELPKSVKGEKSLSKFAESIAEENWDFEVDITCEVSRAEFITEEEFKILNKYI